MVKVDPIKIAILAYYRLSRTQTVVINTIYRWYSWDIKVDKAPFVNEDLIRSYNKKIFCFPIPYFYDQNPSGYQKIHSSGYCCASIKLNNKGTVNIYIYSRTVYLKTIASINITYSDIKEISIKPDIDDKNICEVYIR